MSKKMSVLLRAGYWIAFVAIAAWVLWSWYFPVVQYFIDDDWFVLPERLWFPDAWAWYKHLLFFSQQRLTWVGDFMLYRPGLYTWIWLQDVLFRHERELGQVFLIAVAVFSFTSFVMMLSREWEKEVSVPAALFAGTSLSGVLLFNWPHINGYLIAVALYTFGAYRLTKTPATRQSALVTGAIFFVGTTFHEFVSLTLGFLFALELLFWRRRDSEGSNQRLLSLAIPLALYFSMVLIGNLVLSPPRFFAPGETENLAFDADYFARVAKVQWYVTYNILEAMAPFRYLDETLDAIRPFVVALLLLAGFVLWVVRRSLRQSYAITLCLAPVTVLYFGLLVGRVATRGVVKAHYYPMFEFFLVLFLMLVFGRMVKKTWVRYGLIVFFIGSSIWSSRLLHQSSVAQAGLATATHSTVRGIVNELDEIGDACFAGVIDPPLRNPLVSAANIALQRFNCENRPGRPMYFVNQPDGSVKPVEWPPVDPARKAIDLEAQLVSIGEQWILEPFLVGQSYNLFEAERGKKHDGRILVRRTRNASVFDEIDLRVRATEASPVLYNTGLVVASAKGNLFFLLKNNMLNVVYADGNDPAREVAGSALAGIKSELSLRVQKIDGRCFVLVDEVLIVQPPACWNGPVQVGFVEFENATDPEALVSLTGFKNSK